MNNLDVYIEKVMDYAEYLGLPDYLTEFNPTDVARTFIRAITVMHIMNVTPRMAALFLFGLTWNKIKHGINISYAETRIN